MTPTLTREAVRAAGTSPVLEHRTRSLADTGAQILRASTEDTPRFRGHAAVFDSRTSIGNPLSWGYYEEIARSAFDKTLAEGDARFLVDHNSSLLVARVSAGDLRLRTDDVGLLTEADLDDELTYVRDLTRNLERRRITGMSFGFYVVRDTWEEIEVDVEVDGKADTTTALLRTIEEVRLLEVSAVTFPAYEDTDAALRKITDEVRAARGVPTISPGTDQGHEPAPAAAATRDTDHPAPAQTTRGMQIDDERARALAARYRLDA